MEKEEIVRIAKTVPSLSLYPKTSNGKIAFINYIVNYQEGTPVTISNESSSYGWYHPYALIQVYDVRNNTQILIEDPFVFDFDMYNNTLVFHDLVLPLGSAPENKRVYLCNLNTMKKGCILEITENNSGGWVYVEGIEGIFEDKLLITVSEEKGSEHYNYLYLYNITTGANKTISEGYGNLGGRLNGDRVIYHTDDGKELCVYDIKSGKSSLIKTSENLIDYEIYGDYAVYIERKNDLFAVYSYNLKSGEEKLLCQDEYEKFGLSMWEDKIVWEEVKNKGILIASEGYHISGTTEEAKASKGPINKEMLLYNLTTNEKEVLRKLEVPLTCAIHLPYSLYQNPEISDDVVVWQEMDSESSHDNACISSMRIRYIVLNEEH